VVRRAVKHTSEDIHRAVFEGPPERHSASELKEGVRKSVRRKHARRRHDTPRPSDRTPNLPERFKDGGDAVYAFMGETLVVCPRCGSCARSVCVDATSRSWFAPRRLTCCGCGLERRWAKHEIARHWRSHPVRDDYFELPLWLQAPCCSEVLWAYNHRHLGMIERMVRAPLRERSRDAEYGWSNRSLASRLPRWVKLAKHRAEVLRAIERIREAGT
jgi:hypothetical protein